MGGHGSGGKRKNAGRLAHQAGQLTLDGRPYSAQESRNRQQQSPPITVAEARNRQEQENEKAAAENDRATARIQHEEVVQQEKLAKREREKRNQENAIHRLQEAAEAINIGAPVEFVDGDDDDEDYFSDDNEDYDVDDEDDKSEEAKKKKQSSRYKPRPDTKMYKYLEGIKDSILVETNSSAQEKGKVWYPPDFSAVSKENVDPFNWCSETAWVYHFNPFVQNEKSISKPLKDHSCIFCGKAGTLQSNGWFWRPQHYFDTTIWLLHRRARCRADRGIGGCGRTFAEFHPDFMAQLPNVVVERFPFFTSVSGIGLHQTMMQQFLHLCIKGILFGTYCASINEIKNVRYWKDHLSYLDVLSDKAQGRAALVAAADVNDWFVPQPFYPFKSPGEYNGILLKPRLLRNLFLRVRCHWVYFSCAHRLSQHNILTFYCFSFYCPR
jgi:hypothetical protein